MYVRLVYKFGKVNVMAGEISSNMYNPLLYSSQVNDDFMTQACDATRVYNQAKDPAFTGFQTQPAVDTFQKSSGYGPAFLMAGLGGGLTTAGMYYYGGDKFGINPYKDGKFDDKFLKSLEEKNLVANKVQELKNEHIKKIYVKNGIANEQVYSAIKEIAAGKTAPAGVTVPTTDSAEAKKLVNKVEKSIGKINERTYERIVQRTKTLDGSLEYLKNLNARKVKLTALPETITAEELAKHLKDNAKLYGIAGKDAEAVEANAKKIATLGREKLIEHTEKAVTAQTNVVEGLRKSLSEKIIKEGSHNYWDSAKNAIKEGSPENLTKALRNFKLKSAGKFGAIAAGVCAVIGYVFGK